MKIIIIPVTSIILLGFSIGLIFDYNYANAEKQRLQCLEDYIENVKMLQSDSWRENPKIWKIEQFALKCYDKTWTWDEYEDKMIELGYDKIETN